MVLEDGVNTDNRDLIGRKKARDSLRLRKARLNAAWTQHLKGMKNDDASTKLRERYRF